jgi:Flp pilus assembly protein TadG
LLTSFAGGQLTVGSATIALASSASESRLLARLNNREHDHDSEGEDYEALRKSQWAEPLPDRCCTGDEIPSAQNSLQTNWSPIRQAFMSCAATASGSLQ